MKAAGELTLRSEVVNIGSNVLPDHFGPAVAIGGSGHIGSPLDGERKGALVFGVSLSEFSDDPVGLEEFVSVRGYEQFAGPLAGFGGVRVSFAHDLDERANYRALLMGGEVGLALDFKYVTFHAGGGLGLGFADRDNAARFDTHYVLLGGLDVHFWEGVDELFNRVF